MDQAEIQRRIEEARAEGYSDEEIRAAMGAEAPATLKTPQGPAVPELSPEKKAAIAAEDKALADRSSSENWQNAALLGGGAAALYGGKKLVGRGIEKGLEAVGRGLAGGGPVAPTAMPAPAAAPAPAASPILGANGQPIRPVAPTAVPPAVNAMQGAQAAQTGGNWMANAMNMARQYAPAMAKLGVGTAMMAPTSTGPATPQVGRMRGMEINPLTGRPWTPDQIAQYEANPAVYDQQMAAPQFRR